MNSRVGLNYNSGLTLSKKFCKNYSGLLVVTVIYPINLRWLLIQILFVQKLTRISFKRALYTIAMI
jgi:hypothetical protein